MNATAKPMSPEQSRYLRDLLAEREGIPAAEAIRQTLNHEREQGTLDSRTASAAITALLKVSKASAMSVQRGNIEGRGEAVEASGKGHLHAGVRSCPADGFYAVTLDGTLHYFRVRTVDRPGSRWHGRTFLDEQASDDFYPVRGERAKTVLALIAADPEAGPRYGQTIGRCYKCRRTLTDETSRALGIGPDCRGRA